MDLYFTEKAFKVLENCKLCMLSEHLVGTKDEKRESSPTDMDRAQRVPAARSSASFGSRRGGRLDNMSPVAAHNMSDVEKMFRNKK